VTSRDFQILDESNPDLCTVHPHASVYRLRCAELFARSARKTRRLSKNPGNLLTTAKVVLVTIEGKRVMV
jgi:hypothetical protein